MERWKKNLSHEVVAALKQHGFQLVRHRKHLVFRNAEGRTVCFSSTARGRAEQLMLCQIHGNGLQYRRGQ